MNVEVNVAKAIANNRKGLSMIGSNFGGQFHQVDVRDFFQDFEKEKARIANENNAELFLNRTTKRFRMVSRDIVNIGTKEDLSGQPVVYINEDKDGIPQVTIPFGSDMSDFGHINEDGLKAALKGDKSKIFADPEKLVDHLNALNNKEIRNIDGLIAKLQKAKKSCEDAIAENAAKVANYRMQFANSEHKNTETELEVNVTVDKN